MIQKLVLAVSGEHSVKIRERNDPKKLRTEMDTLHIGKKLLLRQKNFYRQKT